MSQAPPTNHPPDGVYYRQHSESSTPLTSTSPVNSGDNQALYIRLRNQVEFYFSPQNLSRDAYLRNMLTAEHQDVPSHPPSQLMAPVAVITNFPKVRDICAAFGSSLSDPPHVLLARACEGSTVVTVSTDGAWIGPLSQQLPPLMAPAPRMGPPTPQHFQQGPFLPSPHQGMIMMMPAAPMVEVQPMPYMGTQPVPIVQNVPQSVDSVSPSNSLDSMSQAKEIVVVVPDMPDECNPIILMGAFTQDDIRPSSVSVDANTNTWYLTFTTEAEAKAAIAASSGKTIAGVPINTKLKTEPLSPRASVTPASGASLSSMSASQKRQIPVPQMVQQPMPMPVAGMYPPGAYAIPQHIPPPPMQPGIQPYPISGYNMAPMPMPGQPFPQYQQHMQPMYPYGYLPQHFPSNQPPMIGRYGPGVPPPPPRYPGPSYPYQHGPQHQMGDGPGLYQGPPLRQNSIEGRGQVSNNFQEDGKLKNDSGGKKKKNKYKRQASNDSTEGGSNHQSGYNRRSSSVNLSSPNNFGKGKGRQGDSYRRSSSSASPLFDKRDKSHNNNKLSRSANESSSGKRSIDKEIFSANDFPGLSADMASGESQQSGDPSKKHETKTIRGYADALKKKDENSKAGKGKDSTATKDTVVSELDSITRQTEELERDILSDFHDLRLPGEEHKSKQFEHLPILPGMSDMQQSLSLDSGPIQTSALHPSSNRSEMIESAQSPENAEPADTTVDNRDHLEASLSKNGEEEDKPASGWGRRLFSDVRSSVSFKCTMKHDSNSSCSSIRSR